MKMPAGMNHRAPPGQVGVTPEAAFQQAVVLQHRGELTAAEKIYRAILKQYPRHFPTLLNLGTVLLLAERMQESVEVLRKALNQKPNSALVHTLLARALALLDRYQEALQRARRAVALDPALPDAHATLAQGLADLGHYEEAVGALARAIELAPHRPRFYYYMGHITRWSATDPRLATLKALADKPESLPLAEQIELHFALAKADADCGEVERSFRHQIKGGALQRRLFKYDEASTLAELDALSGALDADWMARHQGAGDPSTLPIFVVGMPRSGTSLVEQILASHPKVHGLGERLDFPAALARACGTPTVPPSLAHHAMQWSDAQLRRLGSAYVEAVRRDVPPGAARFVDKLPANFQFIGLIRAALPNARIIHTCRDPVDTCLSAFSMLFSGAAQLYSYDLGELGRYHRAYDRMMMRWRDVLPAGVMLDVRYERIVGDLEGEARRIIAHCGLEWDDACLAFHKTRRAIRTISHAQVRQPIYRGSVGRKRPPRDLLQPLLDALGMDA